MKRGALRRALLVASLLVSTGCLSDADLEPTPLVCADRSAFDAVSPVLETRCGTLDCHGFEGRPFIVYARLGLRRAGSGMDDDPGYRTGGIETTDYERDGTWQSLCGLQPEATEDVVAGRTPPTDLTMVRKPRLEEKHKGGRVWPLDGDGDRCLQTWLAGDLDAEACQRERERR